MVVKGTNGNYVGLTNSVFFDGDERYYLENPDEYINNADKKYEEYNSDYWKNITKEQLEAGHGGMDSFSFGTFFECLKNDLPMPVDVYDAASWMVITPLSEESIRTGKAVEIPDFTNGKWKTRERYDIK